MSDPIENGNVYGGPGEDLQKAAGRTPECKMCGVAHHEGSTCFATPQFVGWLTREKNTHYMARIGCASVLAQCRKFIEAVNPELVESIDAALEDMENECPRMMVSRTGSYVSVEVKP